MLISSVSPAAPLLRYRNVIRAGTVKCSVSVTKESDEHWDGQRYKPTFLQDSFWKRWQKIKWKAFVSLEWKSREPYFGLEETLLLFAVSDSTQQIFYKNTFIMSWYWTNEELMMSSSDRGFSRVFMRLIELRLDSDHCFSLWEIFDLPNTTRLFKRFSLGIRTTLGPW